MNETQVYQLTWTQLVVLKVLSRHRLHGRGINRVINKMFGREFSYSTLHPTFKTLCKKRLVEDLRCPGSRTVTYIITPQGRQVLETYELAYKRLAEYDVNVYCTR